jgi:hypothetical protein
MEATYSRLGVYVHALGVPSCALQVRGSQNNTAMIRR